jgi:hypothetical protein
MDRQLLEPSQMDGTLTYGQDSTGRLIALLPARCKLGRHTFGHSQFRAVVHDGEAHISCLACATDGADHFWRLAATAPAPDRAELSEELYYELVLRRARRSLVFHGPSWRLAARSPHGRATTYAELGIRCLMQTVWLCRSVAEALWQNGFRAAWSA